MGFPGKRLGIFNKLLPRGKMQNVSLLETRGGTGFEVLDLREDSKSNHDICLKGHL